MEKKKQKKLKPASVCLWIWMLNIQMLAFKVHTDKRMHKLMEGQTDMARSTRLLILVRTSNTLQLRSERNISFNDSTSPVYLTTKGYTKYQRKTLGNSTLINWILVTDFPLLRHYPQTFSPDEPGHNLPYRLTTEYSACPFHLVFGPELFN